MIHLLTEEKIDQAANVPLDRHGDSLSDGRFDYSNVIVKKPWGYEYLVFENENVAIWMLHLVRKRKTSMHCHLLKKTALILIEGKALFYHSDGSINLDPMDGVIIGKALYDGG